MQVFDHDDARYVEWLKNNPAGYVLNYKKKPRGPTLHRAGCIFVNNPGPKNWGKLTHEYIKVCSTDEASIQKWIRDEPMYYCQVCFPELAVQPRPRPAENWIKKDDQVFLFVRDTVKLFRVESNDERTEITDLNAIANILAWGRKIRRKTAQGILKGKD